MKAFKTMAILFILMMSAAPALAARQSHLGGNQTNESFAKAKQMLEKEVYFDHRETLYCKAPFDEHKRITEWPKGFPMNKHPKRARRMEWEHAVPAENFGRAFIEWDSGHDDCMQYGRRFKGRKCVEKISQQFRFMQADMYNLFPAIGSVNAARSNYRYSVLNSAKPAFGECDFRIEKKRVQPPANARGEVARAGLYMAWAYPQYALSKQQRQLFEAWNRKYPPGEWECRRYRRIKKLQGNDNPFLSDACQGKGLLDQITDF